MRYLLSAQQMQHTDTYTQDGIGVPSIVLMERAALAVADRIMTSVKALENGRALRAAVLAGNGNNGADALAVGRILMDRGVSVTFYVMRPAKEDGSSRYIQERIIRSYGQSVHILDDAALASVLRDYEDVYIDGLFGVGLNREITGQYHTVIESLNKAAAGNHASVFAVDIPSGVHATDGSVCGICVRATETVTFGFYKRGMFLYPGTTYCGHITLADIGIPSWSYDHVRGMHRSAESAANAATQSTVIAEDPGPTWFTYMEETADDLLPERISDGNKGTFGKALVVAGGYCMSGAATMAASAAGRMGCGMVKVYTRAENRTIIQETVPEALLSVWSPDDMESAVRQLMADLSWADTVAVGPGFGKNKEERELVRTVLRHGGELAAHIILDADAIRIIAEDGDYALLAEAGRKTDVILTPHLSECAALLQTTVVDLRVDRYSQLKKFVEEHHVTILCKDARSMVVSYHNEKVYLNTSGNDGLATAGSGDVLTGILAACTAQGLSALDAAAAASYLHGRLAEHAEAETGRRGLVAPDLYRRLNGAAAVVWSEEFGAE